MAKPRPVGGTSRRYRLASGETISRRQYDNIRARQAGFKNMYEIEQFRQTKAARKWGMDIIEAGKRPSFQDWADIREVRDRRARLAKQHPDMTRRESDQLDRELVAPKGALARILERTGRRGMSNRPVS